VLTRGQIFGYCSSDIDRNNCKVTILQITKLHPGFRFRRWSMGGEPGGIIMNLISNYLPL